MTNRRKFPRFEDKWRISYRILDTDPIHQETVDIGGGGICFIAGEEIAADTMINIEMESDSLPSALVALVKVVWCDRTQQAYKIGTEFQWVGLKDDVMNQGDFPNISDILGTDA